MGNTWEVGEEADEGGRWFYRDDGHGWRTMCRVVAVGGELLIAELVVRTTIAGEVPVGGIDAARLARPRIGGVLRTARDEGLGTGLYRECTEPEAAQAVVRSRKRHDHLPKLAAIALLYDQAWRDGRQADVLVAVSEATNLDARATLPKLVFKARDKGMLSGGGKRGRPGGRATDKALRIAAEHGFTWAPAGMATATATAHDAMVVTS